MNPTTIDPDLLPVHPLDRPVHSQSYPDPRDPTATVRDTINPQPDLTDPQVLIRLGKEYVQGMIMESEAATGIGNQCSCSNPAYFFAQVAKVIAGLVKIIEADHPKPAPEAPKTEALPATPAATSSAEPAKPEPVKSGKK